MTINQVIEQVSRLSPGAVQDRDIARWLLDLDGKLFRELHMPSDIDRPMKWPEDGEKPLTASYPYDGLYTLFAEMKVHFARKDYDSYNNAAIAYNDAVNEYRKAYRRENQPEPLHITTL